MAEQSKSHRPAGMTRREWMSVGAAGAACLAVPGCSYPKTCRSALVGLAGAKGCPHRFCRFHGKHGAKGLACGPTPTQTGRTA